MKIIAKFSKGDDLKYCSHLDMQKLFMRAMSRANIPVSFSQGFNRHPLISIAMALPVGVTSEGEYMEIEVESDVLDFKDRMNNSLPKAVRIVDAKIIDQKIPALMSLVYAAKYRIFFDKTEDLCEKTYNILNKTSIIINKKTKSKIQQTDIRSMILEAKAFEDNVECIIRCGSVNLKPMDFAKLYDEDQHKITRCEMYGISNNKLIELMNIDNLDR